MYHALVLIKEQDEQIFKLENRLKECENGYEQTFYLDRCKLHDAEQKIKELTEELEKERTWADSLIDNLRDDIRELTQENERLKELATTKEVEKEIVRKETKADTVRKMQERLTTLFANDETLEYTEVDAEYINEQIVRIAKEMIGEEND